MAGPEPSSPETDVAIDISIECVGWSAVVKDPDECCRSAARSALAVATALPDLPALSVLLGDDEAIAALNSQFRGKAGPTNVLSFPAGDAYPDGVVMLGDIAVARETVEREAASAGISVADHLSHMIVHGTLHLLGFDHQSDAQAEEMESLEVKVLSGMGIANPYAEPGAEGVS